MVDGFSGSFSRPCHNSVLLEDEGLFLYGDPQDTVYPHPWLRLLPGDMTTLISDSFSYLVSVFGVLKSADRFAEAGKHVL